MQAETLLEVGAKIFIYVDVFCHAKLLIIDEQVGTVGTTNTDIRSFYLNFEVNVMLSQTKSIQTLLESYKLDLKRTTEILYAVWKRRPLKDRLIQTLAHLFSPIL